MHSSPAPTRPAPGPTSTFPQINDDSGGEEMTTRAVPTPGRVATGPAIAMFALLLLAYSVNAMDRMVFPVLLPEVRAEYGFSLDQSGLQSTMFALGMGLTGV